ncbi:MAG TPA: LAGLIDADG family homing endonuclease [Candidatus Nanoarchaeia archaeon]|nr:LAGLIDADG family homing endonuclease [Candidatus Nanoarchaeia archaeon]
MPYNIIVGRNEADLKRLGDLGTIFLGKHFVKMGNTTSLSNPILLDVARTHVILISGKRGCLSGDTKIFTNHGFKDIRDFDEKNDMIHSFNKEKRCFEWENAKLLKYPINGEKLKKIEFKDGRTLTMTTEHPLLLEYGKYLFWRNANEIKEKDKVVSVLKLPEVKNDKESVRIARLLGFILADGTMNVRNGRFKDGRGYWCNGTKARIRVYNNCEEVLEIAKRDIEEEFGVIAKRYKRNDCNCEVIETKHQRIIKKFNELGVPIGYKSAIIRVPKIVFESSNKFKANFVNALFCCDGYVPKDGRNLDYASKSKEFLQDLQLLLKHFEIESVVRKKMVKLKGKLYENYRLFITDNYSIKKFQEKIGFFSKFKHERLMKHGFKTEKDRPRRMKTRYISDELVCPKIKEIKEVDGITEVFDLHVPKNNSFIANGVISHNSGKSYSLSTIAEELTKLPEDIASNIAVVIFDTMGIFWTMKFPNLRDEQLLREWNLKPEGLNINIFTPAGYFKEYKEKGIPSDYAFSIKPSELNADDWCNVFEIPLISPVGILLDRILNKLKNVDHSIVDIIEEINKDNKADKHEKEALENRFKNVLSWGLFEQGGISIHDMVQRGKVSVIDISCYTNTIGSWSIKGLIIGLLSKKLLNDRLTARKYEEIKSIERGSSFFFTEEKFEMPLVWLMIDECHEFLPKEGKTPATDALVQLLREGRQPGISLVLATQQPGEIHKDVITQADIVISHRLTARKDIDALNDMMQTYLTGDILKYLNQLPRARGAAIILDDNSERIYPMQVRPKKSWHGGEAPTAVYKKRKELLDLGL